MSRIGYLGDMSTPETSILLSAVDPGAEIAAALVLRNIELAVELIERAGRYYSDSQMAAGEKNKVAATRACQNATKYLRKATFTPSQQLRVQEDLAKIKIALKKL